MYSVCIICCVLCSKWGKSVKRVENNLALEWLSACWSAVLQKKRMRKKANWSVAGGLADILKACQEITAGRGERCCASSSFDARYWAASGKKKADICVSRRLSELNLPCSPSWPEQLGAEDPERRCGWEAGRRAPRGRGRLGADGASEWRRHGDEQLLPGALQRWRSHAGLHRYEPDSSL